MRQRDKLYLYIWYTVCLTAMTIKLSSNEYGRELQDKLNEILKRRPQTFNLISNYHPTCQFSVSTPRGLTTVCPLLGGFYTAALHTYLNLYLYTHCYRASSSNLCHRRPRACNCQGNGDKNNNNTNAVAIARVSIPPWAIKQEEILGLYIAGSQITPRVLTFRSLYELRLYLFGNRVGTYIFA